MAWLGSFQVLWAIGFAACLSLAPAARAQDREDDYIRVFQLIQRADTLQANGQAEAATARYREAQAALRIIQTNYPTWNVKMITYKMDYLNTRLAPKASAAAAGESKSGADVKLLEPGAEPRKALRLHPKAGDKQVMTLAMKMGVQIELAGNPMPATKLPPSTLTMDIGVKEVSAEGKISYDMTISEASVGEDPDAQPAVVEVMKKALEAVKGLSGTGAMTTRGVNLGMDMKAPADADPQVKHAVSQMRDSLNTIGAPLPEEPIGVGARWEVVTQIKSQGMKINQKSVYELTSVEGEVATITSDITQAASNQKIENPAMPGVQVDLSKLTGNAKSSITYDLGRLLPSDGTVDLHNESSMNVNAGGQKQAMSMKLDLNMTVQSPK